jgi:hypothetical protein
MSEYGFYLERARKASAMLTSMESAAVRRPHDAGLRLNVTSAQRLLARVENDLGAVAARDKVDLCRYRLVVSENSLFTVRGVSNSLRAFQEVFSFVYDALADGPKQTARLSRARHEETALEFGYSFEGSLGIVLIAPGQVSLFGEGKFDGTLDAINGVFDTSSEDALRDKVRALGRASIQKIYEWSNINFGEGFAVDLKWLTPSTIHKGRYLEWKEFERIASLIGRTSDSTIDTITAPGVLVGLSSVSKTFHFVIPDGETYRGQLAEGFPVSREWTINHPYIAEIGSDKITRLSTGEEITRHHLRSLARIIQRI